MSDEKKRTRFSAVMEELTSSVGPMTKPTPGTEVKASTPRLFDQVISVVDGMLLPCPKCGLKAFEVMWMNELSGGFSKVMAPGLVRKLVCRGCKPPASIYDLNTTAVVNTTLYQCGSCRDRSSITLDLDQTNLYCSRCQRATIHDSFNSRAGLNETKRSDKGKSTRPALGDPCARCGHGRARHVPRCQWNATCGCPAFSVAIPGDSGLVDDFAITMADAKAALSDNTIATMVSSVTSQLVESFYDRLGWEAPDVYASGVREMNNNKEGMTGRGIDRRTGRTTRGLLYAFAEVEVRKAEVLWLRGATKMSDALLVAQSEKLRRRLRQPLSVVIRKMPENLDPKRCSADVVYIDHHYYEVLSSTSDRAGRFQF